MDEQRRDDQLEPIYNNSVQIQNVALKTYREWWTIETGSGRGSGKSVLVARHDDAKHGQLSVYAIWNQNSADKWIFIPTENFTSLLMWFQVFLSNTNNLYTIIYGFKYTYLIQIIYTQLYIISSILSSKSCFKKLPFFSRKLFSWQ